MIPRYTCARCGARCKCEEPDVVENELDDYEIERAEARYEREAWGD